MDSFKCIDGYIIKPAELKYLQELIEICKESFPSSLRWQGHPFYARWWWKKAINSNAAIVWVVLKFGNVIGFCVLIHNEKIWKNEIKDKWHIFMKYFLALIFCPYLLFQTFYLKMYISIRKKKTILKNISYENERTWVELIAVSVKFRKKGIGKILLDLCEKRTVMMQKKIISLMVDADNNSAKKMYERCKYIPTGQSKTGYIYSKWCETV